MYNNPFHYAVTNCRSVSAKIGAVVDAFRNLNLGFMCLSETWLRDGVNLNMNIDDLETAHELGMITRNRGSRGGGVAIVYDRRKMKMKKWPNRSKFEFVCAQGSTSANKRPITIISYYIPPTMRSDEFKEMASEIEDIISEMKSKLRDPIVIIGGDANKRQTDQLHEDFEDIVSINCPPSRNNNSLIQCASNINELIKKVSATCELDNTDGTSSDHKVILFNVDMPRQDRFTKIRFKFRPYTQKGEDSFGKLLLNTDWSVLQEKTASEAAEIFTETLESYVNACFPEKSRTIKSNDLPWANRRFKRKVRQRNRCYYEEGKTRRWRRLKVEAQTILDEAKEEFLAVFEKRSVQDGTSRAFFKAVSKLKHREAPAEWDIRKMFPGEPEIEIAEKVATFFNSISAEYEPVVPPRSVETQMFRNIEPYEISARLKSMKKPKGLLRGDINPKLNEKFCDVLAFPLAQIFGLVSRTGEWPKSWKEEIVTIIPKNSCPSEMGELRNLSCTPLYSKLLESFVLGELQKEISLSRTQFGGIKNCGVDHFLVQTWDKIITNLEDGRAATNLVSIDFEKAYNRMDHNVCIRELRNKGATQATCGMVAAFLSGRTMSVKVGEKRSVPRLAPGGSPQGSILGGILFCATVDGITSRATNKNPEPAATVGPVFPIGHEVRASTPLREQADENDEYSSGDDLDESVRFFRYNRPFVLDSSSEEEMMNQQAIDEILGPLPRWEDIPISIQCYIDDFNNIEKVKITGSVSHITVNGTKTLVHAPKSQQLFVEVKNEAEENKMRVNNKKTQMICIHSHQEQVNTYMTAEDGRIVSGDRLKILGFTFGTRPTAQAHLECMLPKMRRRLWTITHLKQAGMSKAGLTKIYFAMIRPVADFAAVAYDSLLTQRQATAIEKVQMRAFKLIFGNDRSYRAVLETMNFKTMKQRREELFRNFTQKAQRNSRFCDEWFPKNHDVLYGIRTRKKYKEFFPRTTRMTKNPLTRMRKFLNEQETRNTN